MSKKKKKERLLVRLLRDTHCKKPCVYSSSPVSVNTGESLTALFDITATQHIPLTLSSKYTSNLTTSHHIYHHLSPEGL